MVENIQTWMMYGCFAALAVIAAVYFFGLVFPLCWERVRQLFSLPAIQRVVLIVFAVGMIHYGATKSTVYYDGGIKKGTTENVISNNLVEIHWQRDTSGGTVVPTSATVYIDWRTAGDTNAPWANLAETTVGEWEWASMITNATNYDYKVWAYYIPPEPVHTNGVWVYKTLKDRREYYSIPLRARIEVNGKAIATPKEKRKDEE